jgi:undecaprenyl-diphosphatase
VTHRVDVLDPVFVGLSWIGVYGAIWIAFALAVALRLERPELLPLAAATVVGSDAIALGLKHLSGRDRPYVGNPEPEPLMTTQLDLSFPSGHAATSFAGATLLALLVPRLTVPFLALAAAIAWSRVYVGVHYPFDVAAGAVLGAGVALVVTALLRLRAAPRG